MWMRLRLVENGAKVRKAQLGSCTDRCSSRQKGWEGVAEGVEKIISY